MWKWFKFAWRNCVENFAARRGMSTKIKTQKWWGQLRTKWSSTLIKFSFFHENFFRHTHTHTELLFWPMWYKIINLLVELHTVMYVLVQFCVYLRVSSSLADFTSWKIYPSLQQIRFRLKIILRARWQVISISKSDTPSSLVSACQKQSSFNFTGEILATAGGDSAHIINGNELARLIYSWGIKTSRSLEDLRIISRATLFLACFSTNVNGQRHSMYLDSYRGTRINNGITFSTLHRTHV